MKEITSVQQKEVKIRVVEIVVVSVILLFCEWFFFRNTILSDALFGDRGDGRLTTLLTEHWWNFFNGKESFSEIAMFFPEEEVFGYTDLFLGYGIIHSIFRAVGMNMFVAYKWTLIVIHVLGSTSMYYLLRSKLKCNVLWSLFGTMAFCFSNTYATHFLHTQLNAVAYLPLLLIFLIGFFQNYNIRIKRNIYAYCSIFWFVLLTYNSWYVACFTGLFCLILLLSYYVFLKCEKVKIWIVLREKVHIAWKDFVLYIFTMIVLYIPFLKIYYPVLKSTSGYSYSNCTQYLPEIIDIINVGEKNLIFGRLMKEMRLISRGYSGEVVEGFSLVLLTLFVVLMFVNRKKNKEVIAENGKSSNISILATALLRAVFASIVICILLIVRLSSNGVSLWWFVYTLVPVVRSMRAVARFLLWLSFPMSVITAYCANKYIVLKKRGEIAVQIVFVALIFASNINTAGIPSSWTVHDEISFISNVSQPPAELESFYIMDSNQKNDAQYIYQLDAFEIATQFGIKTINGYSGQSPSDWNGIWDICSDNYESCVYDWVSSKNLQNVYAYDCATDLWIPSEKRFEVMVDDVFYPAENRFSLNDGLEDHNQGDFVWTGKNCKVLLRNNRIKDTGLIIRMRTQLSWYLAQNPQLDPKMQIFVDGELKENVEVTDDMIEILIPMTDHEGDDYMVEIKSNCYFKPSDIGINEDARNLSVALYYIGDNMLQ